MKRNKIIISLITIIFLTVFIYQYFIPNILNPAQLSTDISCNPEKYEGNGEGNIKVLGYTQQLANGSIEIKIFEDNSQRTTLKHELCHKNQFETLRGNLNSCETPHLKTLLEIECYITENLNDWVFELVYDKIKNSC